VKTDADFLLDVLRDGEWHSLNEILARSFHERGCALTVHSRASDLRAAGYVIVNEPIPGVRRASSRYRLVADDPPATNSPEPQGTHGEGSHGSGEDSQLVLVSVLSKPEWA
jgi:hypothetical protein